MRKTCNKTGETDVADNDAAIVYSKGADNVIVVMSKNAYGSTKEIKKISKIELFLIFMLRVL